MNDWFSAEHHADLAHRYYEAGQWDRALSEIRIALRLNPHQGDWHVGMGLTLDALGRHREAVACFRRALEIQGDDTQVMLHLTNDLIRTGQAGQALDVIQRIHDLDPQCEHAYCQAILAHAQLGDHDAAETAFFMARQIVEQCPVCLDHIAQSLMMRDEVKRAIHCWEQALGLDPHCPDAYANLARAHRKLGHHKKARGFYLRHLREDPGDTAVLLEMGGLLLEMGRSAEAGEKFRRVLELDPTSALAHAHLGQLAYLHGHADDADEHLRTASRLDPELPGVGLLLARLELARGQPHEARRHVEREQQLQGHDARQLVELANLCYELDDPAAAVRVLDPLLEPPADPGTPTTDDDLAAALLCRGAARLMLGQHEHGIADCRRTLRLSPDNVTAMLNLVLAYLDRGRLLRARCLLRRAARLDPKNATVRQLRGRVLRMRWTSALRRVFRATGFKSRVDA